MSSSITIDGFILNGTAVEISAIFNGISQAIKEMRGEDRGNPIWFPITGTNGDGDRIAQLVRLRAESAISVLIVDDETMPGEYYDMIAENSTEFIQKFNSSLDADDVSESVY